MSLPKAVQDQLDQAEALQRQLSGETTPSDGNTVVAETVVVPDEQVAEPVARETPVTQYPDETWEQRFNVMRGKYDAEVPRLHSQVRELNERLEDAIRVMESKAEPEQKPSKLVTDADVESFGEDMVDMVRRAAREEFDALAKRFTDMMDERLGTVVAKVKATDERVAKSDKDKFWEQVLKVDAAPDFDAVNQDPRWFEFLDATIPGTRIKRRSIANDAVANLDADVLIEQVKLFKATIAPVEPTSTPKAKPNLNAQVAPSSSRSSAPPQETGRVWSGAEYAQALDHRNKQRMSQEDYDAGVAEAEQALAEGRVRF